ncbi:SH3 domain protein [Apiospora phragmitis]|uniref:SH3 domain protein n=1 Tax=Apiospora phragmitis TaxID=2905665 RepID=A0ABR1TA80_9PEZI
MASAPFKVKALYEYSSGHEDDLPFEIGQIITITEDDDPDWYGGEYLDASGAKQEGIFPRNFVEKYEPTAPPRPTRPRKKDQPEHTARPEAAPEPTPEPLAEPEEPEDPYEPVDEAPSVAEPRSPKAPAPPVPKPVEPAPVAAPASPAPPKPEPSVAQPSPKAPAQARAPPPVSEKPASFRDRIAAFNKPAAPPVAPFKPSGLSSGSSGFIKKPFVAPPPSRNAYVPAPKEAPTTKVYRREEDPEIREKEAENLETAQHAGLVPASSQEGQDEDQPKPTTLKERIALLQKQQVEAAQRHSEAASKKEKPKRPPPKKRTESDGPQEGTVATPGVGETPVPLERRDTESMDESSPPKQQLPTRRKSSKGYPDDGNEADMSGAGDATEGQDDDLTEREDSDAHPKPAISRAATGATEKAAGEEPSPKEEGEEKAEADDDEDDDPEARRKEELRARMAKMSGGMGMMGMHSMFGPPMPSPAGKKKKAAPEQPEEGASTGSPTASAPPVPTMMALPGLGLQKPVNEEMTEHEESETPEDEDITPVTSTSPRASESARRSMSGPPPLPGGRPAPPPVPAESRPPPPPPPAGVTSPSVGSESDDELSENPMKSSMEFSRPDNAPPGRAPPSPIPLGSPKLPPAPPAPTSAKRASYMSDEATPSSPLPPHPSKRTSMPPPVPGSAPVPPPPTQSRPPPPPPPGVSSRPSTSDEPVASPMKPGHLDNSEEGEVTEYDGDYDTDIASSVPHKEALKSHARDSSLEDNTPVRSPTSDAPPPAFPPPVPSAAAPRAIPPPIPSQPPPSQPPARTSVDAPRGAPPPPPPPTKSVSYAQDDDEYDPYNYSAPKSSVPAATSFSVARTDDPEPNLERSPSYQPAPSERREPPPAPPVNRGPRQSIDAGRAASGRRSTDAARPSMSMESGYVAEDVDLAEHTNWWLHPNSVPPALQGRKDIFFESDESTSSTQGGMTEVTKEIYVLFQDYSQTIITARFDPQNPADTQLDQRHEPPPRSLRQDQLEQAYERYGLQIANAVPSSKEKVVGDGTPHGLLYELLKPFKDVLQPVGTRAYGALVYANIANASTQMHDEIRPGDIISIRNAKFQGKHGPMHAKYSMEVGKPDHVAIVAEWDGVKKKVRAWEQGRESKKVKQESFRLDDLRSGEVKIWRIMPRSWVGWDSQH